MIVSLPDSLRVSDVTYLCCYNLSGCKFWGKSTMIVSLADSLRVSDVTYLCCYNLSLAVSSGASLQ